MAGGVCGICGFMSDELFKWRTLEVCAMCYPKTEEPTCPECAKKDKRIAELERFVAHGQRLRNALAATTTECLNDEALEAQLAKLLARADRAEKAISCLQTLMSPEVRAILSKFLEDLS